MSTEIILPTEPKGENLPARRDVAPPLRRTDEFVESDIALAEIWRILRKRKAIIFRVTFGLFALVLVYTFIQTPRYRSESTIEFSEENSDSLALDEQRPMSGDATSMDYALMQKTQVRALLSDTLALRVIKELGLENPPELANKHFFAAFTRKNVAESGLPLERAPYRRVKVLSAFHQNLAVAAVPGTRMISIQFMNPDPQLSALVVNALVKDCKERYFQNRYTATIEALAWLSTGEGKSTVSLNCAAAFAQQGSRVLLVEADMRRPVLNAFLNLKLSKGLGSMIQGESCPDLPFALPSFPKLFVIPAGPQTSSPSELLGSGRMKELITAWRLEYDYIFFDTPPALSVTDAVVLAPVCDLVIPGCASEGHSQASASPGFHNLRSASAPGARCHPRRTRDG